MLDAQPAAVYPASPDDPSRKSKFGFWLEHHRIYSLTIVLLTNVAVGMRFDPTCRQRNLSSTTALIVLNAPLREHGPTMNRAIVNPARHASLTSYNVLILTFMLSITTKHFSTHSDVIFSLLWSVNSFRTKTSKYLFLKPKYSFGKWWKWKNSLMGIVHKSCISSQSPVNRFVRNHQFS